MLEVKGKVVMAETVTQILTSSIDKRGQEVNKRQQETMRVSKSDDRHVKDRTRKENLEAEKREERYLAGLLALIYVEEAEMRVIIGELSVLRGQPRWITVRARK